MSDIRYEFIMSQIKHIRDIKETEKTKISLVYYEGCQGPCMLKVCKNRDLTEVYKALMEVRHPNVAIVYDCIYENGNTYVLEEYIIGKNLADILEEKGTFSEKETAEIMTALCGGLDLLHRHEPPIIHNDIKTSNIMIKEDGSVKLFDFDISRIYKEDSYKNTKLMGTYEYAAPEHYGFGQSDPRTDIYSLGVTMHEMLTGVGLDQEHNVTYQGSLAKILRKCVEIDRKKRYASATLLKSDLEKQKESNGRRWGIILACICGAALFLLCGMLLSDHLSNKTGTQVAGGLGNESAGGSETNNDEEGTGMFDDTSKGNSETEGDENTEGDLETEGIENTEGVLGTEDGLGIEENTETGGSTGAGSGTETEGSSDSGGDSGTEDTSNSEDDSAQGNTSEESDETDTSKKSIRTVCEVSALPKAMAAWTDGTPAMVEQENGMYYLRSTDGKERTLEGLNTILGARLACHPHTDQMYLFLYYYGQHAVYSVNKNLEIELLRTFDFTGTYETILFYPDGTIGYLYKQMILDGKDLSSVGVISHYSSKTSQAVNESIYLINGKIYTVEEDLSNKIVAFVERDSEGNMVREYPLEGVTVYVGSTEQLQRNGRIYEAGDAVYILAESGRECQLLRFDGEKYETIAYLKDYEEGEGIYNYLYLYVTDNSFGLYNIAKKTIFEYPLE